VTRHRGEPVDEFLGRSAGARVAIPDIHVLARPDHREGELPPSLRAADDRQEMFERREERRRTRLEFQCSRSHAPHECTGQASGKRQVIRECGLTCSMKGAVLSTRRGARNRRNCLPLPIQPLSSRAAGRSLALHRTFPEKHREQEVEHDHHSAAHAARVRRRVNDEPDHVASGERI
jgi:hypothetical protein